MLQSKLPTGGNWGSYAGGNETAAVYNQIIVSSWAGVGFHLSR